jgi:hypothetical protein
VTVFYQEDLRLTFTTIFYSMEQSPWEANWSSASKEIPRILWNPKVHYTVCKIPLTVPILSQIKLVHTPHPTSWRSILILSYLRLDLPSGLLLSGFPAKTLYASLLSPHPLVAYIYNAENIVQEDDAVPHFMTEDFGHLVMSAFISILS